VLVAHARLHACPWVLPCLQRVPFSPHLLISCMTGRGLQQYDWPMDNGRSRDQGLPMTVHPASPRWNRLNEGLAG
jgi:hypothetical protein